VARVVAVWAEEEALPAEAADQSAARLALPAEALGVLLRLLHPQAVLAACPVAIPACMAPSRTAA
jgi:hypothetical protein